MPWELTAPGVLGISLAAPNSSAPRGTGVTCGAGLQTAIRAFRTSFPSPPGEGSLTQAGSRLLMHNLRASSSFQQVSEKSPTALHVRLMVPQGAAAAGDRRSLARGAELHN